MHLADAFIQSDLQFHSGYTFLISMCSLGIEPTTFCAANAMLYHWATQEPVLPWPAKSTVNYCYSLLRIMSTWIHVRICLVLWWKGSFDVLNILSWSSYISFGGRELWEAKACRLLVVCVCFRATVQIYSRKCVFAPAHMYTKCLFLCCDFFVFFCYH